MRQIECNLCRKVFSSGTSLSKHKNSYHGKSKCEFCQKKVCHQTKLEISHEEKHKSGKTTIAYFDGGFLSAPVSFTNETHNNNANINIDKRKNSEIPNFFRNISCRVPKRKFN